MAIGDRSSSVRNWIDRFVSSLIIEAHGAVTGLVIYSSWVQEAEAASAVRFSVHRHLSQPPPLSSLLCENHIAKFQLKNWFSISLCLSSRL